MIVERIATILFILILIIGLSIRFVKRYHPENMIILALLSFGLGTYIYFCVYNVNIPILFQIALLIVMLAIPLVAIYLQYNNIILARKILYYKMKKCFRIQEYNRTIEYINRLVALEGRKAEYMYIIGICYKKIDDFINARDSFALAVELNKSDYRSYFELGKVLDETNKKETAIVMFNKALKIKPDFYEGLEALGICLTSQGFFKQAINIYRKALKFYPNSYELWYNIGMLNMELKEFEQSEEAFKKAGEIRPDLYMAHYNVGKINYLKGNYDEAIEAYKKVVSSNNYGPKAYYKLAIVYATKKEYDKALGVLEYAIELNSNFIEISKNEVMFSGMKDMLNEFLSSREEKYRKEKDKHNYMKDGFKLFGKIRNKTVEEK